MELKEKYDTCRISWCWCSFAWRLPSYIGRTAERVVYQLRRSNTGFHMDKFARLPHIFVGSSKVQSDLEAGSSSGRFKRSIASRNS